MFDDGKGEWKTTVIMILAFPFAPIAQFQKKNIYIEIDYDSQNRKIYQISHHSLSRIRNTLVAVNW